MRKEKEERRDSVYTGGITKMEILIRILGRWTEDGE